MIHSYTYTNLFTAELIDRGYRFLARDENSSLYAYKTEPNYDGSCWDSAPADKIPLFPSCIEERIADWNLKRDIPTAILVDYAFIKPGECIRI